MPPFQWQAPPQPYVNTIGDLLRAPGYTRAEAAEKIGDVQARAALQSGQAWGQGIQQAGQAIGSIPERIQQGQANDQKLQIGALQLKQAKQTDAAQAAFVNRIKSTPSIPIEAGGPFDVPSIVKGLADDGFDPTVTGEHLAQLNGSFQQAYAAKMALIKQGAGSIAAAGNDPGLAAHFLDTLEQTQMYPPATIAQFRSAAQTKEGVAQLTAYLMGPQKAEVLHAGDQGFNPVTNQPIPGLSVAEKPTKETLAATATDPTKTPAERARAKATLEAMGDNQQITDDRRYEDIVARGKQGQPVSASDSAWAQAHEQMKGLAAPTVFQGAGGTVYTIPKAGGAAVPVEGVQSRPEQEFVTRGGKVVPIPKGTAQPGDVPYTPSQNEGAQQSKYENQYRQVLQRTVSSRSGGLGLEDQKVNQALHLISIFDQNRDPKTGEYTIPKVLQMEVAMGLARLISPTGVVGEGTVNAINQRTAKGDLAGLVTYLTGTPVTGNTQDVFKMFKDSIERQGAVAESNRETYLDALRALAPTDLEEDRKTRMEQALKLNRMPKAGAFDPAKGGVPKEGDTMQKYGATYKWDGTGWVKQK